MRLLADLKPLYISVVTLCPCRVLELHSDVNEHIETARSCSHCSEDLNRPQPRSSLQAVMELGAKVCTVHQPPDCAACPIGQQCQAHAEVEEYRGAGGDPASAPSVMAYPCKVEKAKRAEQSVAACVLELRTADTGAEPQLLLVQRPEKGLLASACASRVSQ